ncbi:MAG: [FeFe] hydrogenase H-cluster maturation GTPase HydF [bacterium]|nr:[FeFe] hydrogenase H-cluster maturation GTPase HydF [bacterium]
MSLTNAPSSERTHIAFFGCTNSGKSSLVNAITGQNLSIVSDTKGTTTDAVKKTMEILPLGPVVIIDTAGVNDESSLGAQRIEKTQEVLRQTDIAVLVADATIGLQEDDKNLIKIFEEKKIPYIVVWNKSDLIATQLSCSEKEICVSAKTEQNINELKELLAKLIKNNQTEKYIVSDKLSVGDVVVLVIPIDESAPKGRLILPQQLTLRELLDKHCIIVCSQVEELETTLKKLPQTKLVITDSQAFNQVSKIVPESILLTSFSILFANYKGNLEEFVKGAKALSNLKTGDKVLISEGCTHHRQCNDIGTVKIPKLIEKFTGIKPVFEFTSGGEFPVDISKYSLIIHCGACMLNEQEMKSRISIAQKSNIPIVNYGIAIAYMNGILKRGTQIFPEIHKDFE